MKPTSLRGALSRAFLIANFALGFAQFGCAQITVDDPSYSVSTYFAGPSADSIVSYDWAPNGNIYYETSPSDYSFGGVYQYNGSSSTQVVAGSASAYSGASVVASGQYVYYNFSDNSNQYIGSYGPLSGSAAPSIASTAPNYALTVSGGNMFIAGAPGFGTNHIYYSGLGANGSLQSNPPIDLGVDSGSSGPLAFDGKGDLFYAPGFGDLSIYRWSAADVAAALADPLNHPLSAAGHQWADYSANANYNGYAGGSALLVDGDKVLVTLTNFGDPSLLVSFDGADNTASDASDTILSDSGRIGDLRTHNGELFLSSDNQLLQVTPEPQTLAIIALGAALSLLRLARRRVALT